MLNVQEYLRKRSLQDLENEHAVKHRIVRGYKVNLNYDTLTARPGDPIADECRGLVIQSIGPLDVGKPLGPTEILAHPFHRFYNLGQRGASEVELGNQKTRVFDKADGTLCICYFDPVISEWCIGTRSVPEADCPLGGWTNMTFRSLFEKALFETNGEAFNKWATRLDIGATYMFELCTPENQVVVAHNDYRVVLLGLKQTSTGEDLWKPHRDIAVPVVESYSFSNTDDLVRFVNSRDPKTHEGVVACQEVPREPHFRRVKVKNPDYFAYSKLRDSVDSPRTVMQLILDGKLDDAIPIMPARIRDRALEMEFGLQEFLHKHNTEYARIVKERKSRKDFAIAAKASNVWFDSAMQQYTGRVSSPQEYITSRKKDGSYPKSFLDSLIGSSENATK